MTPANGLRSKFSSLPAVLQVMIVGLALIILAVWVGAFIYSYNALYAVGAKIQNTGRVAWIWPFLLDGQIVASNFGLALATAFERGKGLMKFWVAISLASSVGFNIWHVIDNRVLWLVAAVAPVTIEAVCFVGVKVLDWTLTALGKPTKWVLPEQQIGYLAPPQTTVVQLPDGSYGVPNSPFPGYGAGTFPPQGPYGQMPSPTGAGNPQIGPAEIDDATKRQAVEMYLSHLTADQLGVATASSVVVALAGKGMPIGESYAGRILSDYKAAQKSRNGARTSVRRKA